MTAEERRRAGVILALGGFLHYERSTDQQDRAGIDDYMLGLAIQRKTRSKAYADILIELGHDGIEGKGWWFTRAADVTIYFTPAWVAAWRTSEQTDDAAVDFAHRFPCFQHAPYRDRRSGARTMLLFHSRTSKPRSRLSCDGLEPVPDPRSTARADRFDLALDKALAERSLHEYLPAVLARHDARGASSATA